MPKYWGGAINSGGQRGWKVTMTAPIVKPFKRCITEAIADA